MNELFFIQQRDAEHLVFNPTVRTRGEDHILGSGIEWCVCKEGRLSLVGEKEGTL